MNVEGQLMVIAVNVCHFNSSTCKKTLQYLEMYGLEKNMLSDKDVEIIYVNVSVLYLKQIQKKEVYRLFRK